MVNNETVDHDGRGECSRCAAGELTDDQIPVREFNSFKRRRRFVSDAERKGSGRKEDPLTRSDGHDADRWYETKAVRDLIQAISYYNDEEEEDDDDWARPCRTLENDSQGRGHQSSSTEEIPEKDSCKSVENFQEPCFFSVEYFKMKWRKFRDLIDFCYPALARNKKYYRCGISGGESTLYHSIHSTVSITQPIYVESIAAIHYLIRCPYPCCPSRDPERKPEHDQVPPGPPVPTDPKPQPGKIVESPKDVRESEIEEPAQGADEKNQQSIVKPCCVDDDFWTTLLQILILAPLLAFTAYLFFHWYQARREYKKKLGKLNILKRDNQNLMGEIDRLDAFVMSCQMSPFVSAKRQCKLAHQVWKIRLSLKNHKEKIKELEQDRAIYREVLWNLKTCA